MLNVSCQFAEAISQEWQAQLSPSALLVDGEVEEILSCDPKAGPSLTIR